MPILMRQLSSYTKGGIDDAIEGKYPATKEWEYLKGYSEGLKQIQARMKCELALLRGEASEVEKRIEEF